MSERTSHLYGLCYPKCGSDDTGVKETRPANRGIRRRRKCKYCGTRLTTMETIVEDKAAAK